MASTTLSALRSAYLVLPRQTLSRTVRLDVKRSFYLSTVFQGKKKKSNRGNIETNRAIGGKNADFLDAEIDGDFGLELDVASRDRSGKTGSGREMSPKFSTVIKVDSLMDTIKIRREQASRTLLFAPDLNCAKNPCPRYMRHKIENLVGRVRHVALTSVIVSSKTDVQAYPTASSQGDAYIRKSLLVEFQDQDQMNRLINNFTKQFPNDKATFNNRLLYCRGRWSQSSDCNAADVDLNDALNLCTDVSEQMHTLVQRTQLDDAGVRARFFLCDVIESLTKAIFPGCHVVPFGSTVSGLGRADSDMDVVLRLPAFNAELDRPFMAFSMRSSDMTDSRAIVVRQLGLIHEILRMALPGYCEFHRIFRANVPIVTFKHSYTNLCCDLSVQSTDSILAAQLFYTYTQLDPRVRPLLFALRRWSIAQNLSNFVTNFPLCCLTLFYLMEEKVVPPMNVALGDDTGHVSAIPMTIRWKSPNTSSTAEDLLVGFFRFYSTFDFDRVAISVFLGKRREKVTTDMVEVENPLDRDLNCARLIEHSSQFPALLAAIRCAADALEEKSRPPVVKERKGMKSGKGTDVANPLEVAEDASSNDWGVTLITSDLKKSKSWDVMMDHGDDPEMTIDADLSGPSIEEEGSLFNHRFPRPDVRNPPPNLPPKDATLSTKESQIKSILEDIFQSEKSNDGKVNEENFSLSSINYIEDEVKIEDVDVKGASGLGTKR